MNKKKRGGGVILTDYEVWIDAWWFFMKNVLSAFTLKQQDNQARVS